MEKPPQPTEVSLKYIAWDVKQMSKAMQDIARVLEEIKKAIELKIGF